MIDFMLFSERLKEMRLAKGLTLLQLGKEVGATKAAIGNLENCNKLPSLAMADALADFFDVSLDYLVGRSDNPERR